MEIKVKHAKNVRNIPAREALECMKKSLQLSMGMTIETSLYLERMFNYKKYCMKTTRNDWTKAIYGVMMSVNDEDLDVLEAKLNSYEEAAKLMQRLQSEPVDEVALFYSKQTLSNSTRGFIELLILEYSEHGLEFDEAIRKIEESKEVRREEIANKGIIRAEDFMDRFMEKLNNDEFPKDTEPKSADEFIPTDEMAEKIIKGYHEILEEIKKLELK